MGSTRSITARGCSTGKVESPVEEAATGQHNNDELTVTDSESGAIELQTNGSEEVYQLQKVVDELQRQVESLEIKLQQAEEEVKSTKQENDELQKQVKSLETKLSYSRKQKKELEHELTETQRFNRELQNGEAMQRVVHKLQEAEDKLQVVSRERFELQNKLQTLAGNSKEPDYETLRTRTLGKLKMGRQSTAGKAIDAFLRELKHE